MSSDKQIFIANEVSSDVRDNQDSDVLLVNGVKRDITCQTPSHRKTEVSDDFVPPDGGWRAWLVLFCCCLTNGIIFGIINTFGILYDKLHKELEAAGEEDAALKGSLVGSLAIGTTFFLSCLVGVLADKIGIRPTAVLGGVIATTGMALSTFFSHKIEVLYFSYGILFGVGSSLAYTPSLTILGHYFRRHMGVANGIVTAGSSVFTITLSFLNPYLLQLDDGLKHCFQLFTCLTFVLILCGFTFKPLIPARKTSHRSGTSSKVMELVEKVIHLENFRNRRYVIWAIAIPSALFGYFVPYVHIVSFAKKIPLSLESHVNDMRADSLVTCIGITSGVGRLIFGKVADMARVKANGNRVVLQQAAFTFIGLCTMLLTAATLFPQSVVYTALMIFCLIMGFFDGCFITMLGPIAFDLCGPAGASQAIGFLLCLCSFPLTMGPPIAGALYDHFQDYTLAFILAGVPPIVGAISLLCLRRFPPMPTEGQGPVQPSQTTDTLLDEHNEKEQDLERNGEAINPC